MNTKNVVMRNGKTRKEVKDMVNAYLLAAVDGESYGKELTTEKEKVNFVMETFKSEYLHRNNRQGKMCTLFGEWPQGLPSSFNIDFENYRILEIAKEWGSIAKTDSEAKKDKILGNWFNYIANKFFQLHSKLNRG